MSEKRLIKPAALFDLETAKAHMRVYYARDDAYITTLIGAATGVAERVTRRAIASQQWAFTFSGWCNPLLLGRGQLISVDSITYYDSDHVQQTLAPTEYYTSDTDDTAGKVYCSPSSDGWPALSTQRAEPITVTATVGFNEPDEDLVHAVKMQMAHFFENRETVVVSATATEIPEGSMTTFLRHQIPLFR